MLQVLWCESNVLVLSYPSSRDLAALTDCCCAQGKKVYCIKNFRSGHCARGALPGEYCNSCQPNGWQLRQESDHFMRFQNAKMRDCQARELEKKAQELHDKQAQTRAKRQHRLAEWREACEAAETAGQKKPRRPGGEV